MIKSFQAEVFINCIYGPAYPRIYSYACTSWLTIVEGDRKVIGVSQNHTDNRNNSDVDELRIIHQEVGFIPENINMFFDDLSSLLIINCSLMEVSKHDLKGFPKLQLLDLSYNKLQSLKADLFEYSSKLMFLNFEDNKIVTIGSETFKPLNRLVLLNLSSNSCIDKYATSWKRVRPFVSEIALKCSNDSSNIQEIRNEIVGSYRRKSVVGSCIGGVLEQYGHMISPRGFDQLTTKDSNANEQN